MLINNIVKQIVLLLIVAVVKGHVFILIELNGHCVTFSALHFPLNLLLTIHGWCTWN